jgi:Leucine-rich repeat (LRR) protein
LISEQKQTELFRGVNRVKLSTLIFGAALALWAQGAAAQDRTADSVALLALKAANPKSHIDTVNEILWDYLAQTTNAWRPGNPMNKWLGVVVKNDRVTALNLNYCGLGAFPVAPGALSELQTLNLVKNKFTEFPSDLRNLKKLASLNLSNNRLSTFPAGFIDVPLKKLDLSDNLFTEIPREIFGVSGLDSLFLYNNGISTLPDELFSMVSLKYLWVSGNQLSVIPPGIGSLVNLEVLYLSENKLSALPVELKNLVKLKTLSVSGNQIERIDGEILGCLAQLTSLGLGRNKLAKFPEKLETLPFLKSLSINHNLITALPPEIGAMKRLESFNCDSNLLTGLPPGIGALGRLTTLSANDNQIDSLPPELGQVRIEYLSLNGNRLRTIPLNLDVRRNLDLQHNRITVLPSSATATDWTWNGSSMERIHLNDNLLTSLPKNITRLKELSIPYSDFSKNLLAPDSLAPDVVTWLDSMDSDWRHTQKTNAAVRPAKAPPPGKALRLRLDKSGLHFSGGDCDRAEITIMDASGRVIAAGTVRSGALTSHSIFPGVVVVRLRGRETVTFRAVVVP